MTPLAAVGRPAGNGDNVTNSAPEALVVARLCYPPETYAQCELVAARCRLSAGALARLLGLPTRGEDAPAN